MSVNLLVFCWTLLSTIPSFDTKNSSIFYVGIEGYIQIHLNGCNDEDIQVKISGGHIYKRSDSTYAFMPQYESEDFKIKLYYKKVICEVLTGSVKRLPELIPVFGNEKNNSISLTSLPNLGKLVFEYPTDYPESMKSDIHSFNIFLVASSGAPIYSSNNKGDTLDEGTMAVIKKLTKDSKILINNILVNNPIRGMNRIQASREILITD